MNAEEIPATVAGLTRALELAADALEDGTRMYFDALDGHLSSLNVLYRLMAVCLDAHEAGHDEEAWATLRRGMEKAKTLELELLAIKTEMVGP